MPADPATTDATHTAQDSAAFLPLYAHLWTAALRSTAVGLAIRAPDGCLLDANEAYCCLLGYSLAELRAADVAAPPPPDDRELSGDHLAALAGGESDVVQGERRLRRKDGAVFWAHFTTATMRDDRGQMLGTCTALQDITVRKETEAALRESDARLEALLAHLPAALYRQDAPGDGSATYVSPSFATLLGLDPNNFPLGFSAFFDRIHPDDRERARLTAAVSEQTGAPFDLEYRLRREDGDWIWIHDRSVVDRDSRGQSGAWTGVLIDITDRKRLEAAVEEQETRLQSIIAQLPAAVYRYAAAPQSRYTFASAHFEALAGLAIGPDGMTLEQFFARIHPDDIATMRALDAEAGKSDEPYEARYRLRGADGSWIWVQERATPERDDRGQPVAWHGVLLDITARKAAEAALHTSEALFRSIFEGAGIGMALSDPNGRILVANPAMGRFLGYSTDELIDLRIVDFTHPGDFPAQDAMRAQLLTGALDSYLLEKRYVHRDGRIVWGLVNVTAVRNDDGTPRELIGQVQDITARKEAEAALRDSEARFRALVQNDPDVILVINAAREVIYASPSAQTIFGVPAGELLGPTEPRFEHIHPEDLSAAIALLGQVASASGASASMELRIRDQDLVWRWFQLTATNHLTNPSIGGYVCNLRDITDRKQAELIAAAALQTQQAAIAELERLNQSKTRFLATISHEFRTPLTAIIGFSELLAAADADPKTIAEDAGIIHREANRLNRMVGDVLLIEQLDAGRLHLQLRPVDLNALVRDVVETCRPLAAGHQFVFALDPHLPFIAGDRDRLSQALTNLVGNAMKYSPPGKTVTITSREDGDGARIAVRDEGIGIAPQDLTRIFDRFDRVETGMAGRVSGTGLGLAIAREIAHLHHGRLWVESEPGLGATFFLAIPTHPPAETRSPDRTGEVGYTPPPEGP